MAAIQIFLSSVSAEFRSYRDVLRRYLERHNVTVKVQEDFIATGTETLDMLDLYIKHCDAVIHLVGDMTGALAQAPSVTAIRQRHADFAKRLPVLSEFLKPDGPGLPYTQWEAWLALYHGKPLFICKPNEGAPRYELYRESPEERLAQQAHLDRLKNWERHPSIQFANPDALAAELMRSHILDMLAAAGVGQAASARLIDFSQERMRHGEIIGREEAIGTVRGWIEDAAKGWGLIKGSPGTGKSAIVLAILDQLEKEYGAESIPHHFLRRDQGNWNEPDAIVPNLIARLERISESAERDTTQGLERLNKLLNAVGEQHAANNRRLVLMVDGLDEVAGSGKGVLGSFLPATVPDNVFIVCASRPDYPELGWLEERRGLRTIDLDQPPWLANNRSVVEAYWRKRGPQLKPPLDAEVLEKAIDAAEGNMLHAVTLCDVFEVNTEARDPNRIPVGFNALLEDLWLRLVELKDRDTSARVIDGLGLLAVAREALPLGTLARLLGWKHPADIADFKRYALPFLLEENADWHGGEARYRPFHERTREFLTSGDHMLREVNRNYHQLLARRLGTWPPADDADQLERTYAARFALMHLSAIGDWPRVTELLGDLRYGVAALEALGPQLLLARLATFLTADKPAQLVERARMLHHVLRLESQWLETSARELPSLVHNYLTCRGWSRDQIRLSFKGFDSGWGLINAVETGGEICILRGHAGHIKTCAIDSRGRYGVSGGWDGTLRIWDLSRGTSLHALRSHPEAVRIDVDSCAISPNGRHVIVALTLIQLEPRREYGRIQIWDARQGELLLDSDHDRYHSTHVAFATNDKAVVCHSSGLVDVYDPVEGTCEHVLLDEAISDRIAVNRSATLIAAITPYGCGVWKLSDGSKVSVIPFDGARVCSFGPDDVSVAVASNGSALIANSTDGSVVYRTDAIGKLSDCRMLDGKSLLFTSDSDCELVVWDMETDRAVVKYQGHTNSAACCAVTPDGRLALSGGGDHTVRLWSLLDQVSTSQVDRHPHLVYGCTVDADATLACSAPQGDRPAIWNARTGTRVLPVNAELRNGSVRFCRFDGHPRIATLGRSLRVFDPETEQLVREAEFPVADQFDWIDDGATDGTQLPLLRGKSHFIIWQPNGELQVAPLTSELAGRLNGGQAIAALHATVVEIINLDGSEVPTKIAEGVKVCVGSPRSNAVYALRLNGQLVRLDAASGKVLAVLGEIKQEHVRLLIDPQESVLWALCSSGRDAWQAPTDETLIAFSPKTSSVIQQASIPGHHVAGTCFLSGRLITAGWSDATLRIWDAHQPMPLAAVSGSSPFRCVAAAGDRIVAGDQKGNVWFLAPMQELYP